MKIFLRLLFFFPGLILALLGSPFIAWMLACEFELSSNLEVTKNNKKKKKKKKKGKRKKVKREEV